MDKYNWLKRITAFVLLIVIASIPFFAMASEPIWGYVHGDGKRFCPGPDPVWLIYHPNEDWFTDTRYDYYDYVCTSETEHTCTQEMSGVCIFCQGRVTRMITTIPQEHTHSKRVGTSQIGIINHNATSHATVYKDIYACNCGHRIAVTRKVLSPHNYRVISTTTRPNGDRVITSRCPTCGGTKVQTIKKK